MDRMEPVKPTSLLARLRARGDWRVTAHRRVIAEILEGEHVHLTADEICRMARSRMPEISLATVYNALSELVRLGEVNEVKVAGGPVRYDPNVNPAHHHLVCIECGDLHDVQPRGRLTLPASQRFGHRIIGQETVFRGYCPRCSSG